MTEPNIITVEEWRPVVGLEEYFSVSNIGNM